MSRSEDVLLIVKHVKYKKVDGSFYVMSARIAWMNQSAGHFRISAAYEDTRVQRISPNSKEKVQLQLLMNDGTSYTFQFSNPASRDKQLEDRDAVKEFLQQLLPKFKNKVHSELEEKRRVLLDNPELMSFYKELVVSGIMSVEEFWSHDSVQRSLESKEQSVGVPSHLLSDIKPQTDGANGTKYNLTGETIEAIFRTYPAVRKKHLEKVPGACSEQEFWIKFFQSHYFHRDRLHISKDDLFAECATQDEAEMHAAAVKASSNGEEPLLDLAGQKDSVLGEGFGLETSGEGGVGGQAQANHQLVQRFNHHSLMVLRSLDKAAPTTTPENPPTNDKTTKRKSSPEDDTPSSSDNRKRSKLTEKCHLTELTSEPEPQLVSLRVDRMEMYLSGPTRPPAASGLPHPQDALTSLEHTQDLVADWQQVSTRDAISSYTALKALSQISGGQFSSSSANANTASPASLLPTEMCRDVMRLYRSVGELLRHLWLCFPVTTAQLAEKLERTKESLVRFRTSKLEPFKAGSTFRQDLDVTQHLDELIDTALAKYTNWKSRLAR